MTRASTSSRGPHRRALGVSLVALLAGCGGDDARPGALPAAASKGVVVADSRPFTPWHRADQPLPFPKGEWYWQELMAVAPQPEPLPSDAAATLELKAGFERVAARTVLQAEEEIPALLALARKDPGTVIAALDDPGHEVRFTAARLMLRMISSREPVVPQRLVEAAARHLRDPADEVALLHLETVARSGFPWTAPILLRTFGKVDNHRLTVLRIRAAAKLALAHNYGGMPLMIKSLKENTSIQDDLNREWDASWQTAWWKEEAMVGIAAAAGTNFGHSPDASDADQVACVRRIEQWWSENQVRLWSAVPAIDDPALIEKVKLVILGLGTFQMRNIDNAVFILTGLGPKVAPWLFEALDGSGFMIRRHVLAVLAALVTKIPTEERERWIARVAPALADRDPAIRVCALEVIGAARIPAALPYLEKAFSPGDLPVAETALRLLSVQPAAEARAVLQRLTRALAPDHVLHVPALAARLASGDLAPLAEYHLLLEHDDARARTYLSWVVDDDGLADAKTPEQREAALVRLEAAIRARAR